MSNSKSEIITEIFGGMGGNHFSLKPIKSIRISTGDFVDSLEINGNRYGGSGGYHRPEALSFSNEEYINKITIRSHDFVDRLELKTNLGNSLSGGGNGGSENVLSNMRVLRLGGRSANLLDRLTVQYIKNYSKSETVVQSADFILSFHPPGSTLTHYESTIHQTAHNWTHSTKFMNSTTVSSSIEGEYFIKASASLEMTFEEVNTRSIEKKLTETLEEGDKVETKVNNESVALVVCKASILKNDDTYWMFPQNIQERVVHRMADTDSFKNYYDLNGLLYRQIPDLNKIKSNKNGFTHYG